MESPWKVLIEVPSNDPDTFLTAAKLTSLEALRVRLGDGFYAEAMRQLTEQPPRSVPTDRQHDVVVHMIKPAAVLLLKPLAG